MAEEKQGRETLLFYYIKAVLKVVSVRGEYWNLKWFVWYQTVQNGCFGRKRVIFPHSQLLKMLPFRLKYIVLP